MAKGREVVGGREYIIGSPEVLDIVGVDSWAVHGRVHIIINNGLSRQRHLQGTGCKTGLCGQAWSFPLFDPM